MCEVVLMDFLSWFSEWCNLGSRSCQGKVGRCDVVLKGIFLLVFGKIYCFLAATRVTLVGLCLLQSRASVFCRCISSCGFWSLVIIASVTYPSRILGAGIKLYRVWKRVRT